MGRPAVLVTSTVCPDCDGPKYRYATYCRKCKAKGDRNAMAGRQHSAETRAKIAAKASRPRPERRGALHPMWKGDAAGAQAGRDRAVALYPLQPCEVCGDSRAERHHRDANTLNNAPQNISFLCRRHHRQIHPGHGPEPLKVGA